MTVFPMLAYAWIRFLNINFSEQKVIDMMQSLGATHTQISVFNEVYSIGYVGFNVKYLIAAFNPFSWGLKSVFPKERSIGLLNYIRKRK